MAHILVTGADGFLGSHITDAALAAGHSVTEVSMYRPEGTTGYASEHARRGDIADPIFMRDLVAEADAVVNCAAFVSVPYSETMPGAYWRTNATAVFNLLQLKPRRFVQVSTSEVFDGISPPYHDESNPNPITVYGASKAAAEMACRAYDKATIVRVFNMFGPRQYPRAVHPLFIREALRVANGDKDRAELDGPHGSRAFLYAPWVAEAIIDQVLTEPRKLVQLASETPVQISDLWGMVAQVVGIDPARVRWNAAGGKRGVANLFGRSSSGYPTPEYRLDWLRQTVDWYAVNQPFAAANYQ